MNELLIKVKIGNAGFLVDLQNNVFRSLSDPDNMVLFNDCIYREGKWYVLWNRKDNTVYNGLRKMALPPYVSETLVDFLDNGRQVKRTILQTIGALTDTIIHILLTAEGKGTASCNEGVYN